MHAWLSSTAVWLLAVLGSWQGELDDCPGLVTKPEPRREPWNIRFAKELVREVREADAGKGFELIFYGDSITEQWRGTDQGGLCTRCTGDTAIFDKYFGHYRAGVLAVGGDQVGHLLWRLQHGDVPELHQPRVVVLMIGINDLGAAADCSRGDEGVITAAASGVVDRLATTISLLHTQLPHTHIVALALLPRGDGSSPDKTFQWPGRYTKAIETVNSWLEVTAAVDDSLTYLDCGPLLLQGGKISPDIQVDGLHPSPAGMEIMGQCISPVVDGLMGRSSSSGSSSHAWHLPAALAWLG